MKAIIEALDINFSETQLNILTNSQRRQIALTYMFERNHQQLRREYIREEMSKGASVSEITLTLCTLYANKFQIRNFAGGGILRKDFKEDVLAVMDGLNPEHIM